VQGKPVATRTSNGMRLELVDQGSAAMDSVENPDGGNIETYRNISKHIETADQY
jgi:hypothetical protein